MVANALRRLDPTRCVVDALRHILARPARGKSLLGCVVHGVTSIGAHGDRSGGGQS